MPTEIWSSFLLTTAEISDGREQSGGSQNGEYAWRLKVDDNGGLYLMVNVSNIARTTSTNNNLPIRFDENNVMPFVTAPADPASTVTDTALKTAYIKVRYLQRKVGMAKTSSR